MRNMQKFGTTVACAFLFIGAAAVAQEEHHEAAARPAPHGEAPHGQAPRGEPHAGPKGYERVAPPRGWNTRPTAVDHAAYQHNFRAASSFHIGPYHRPAGWAPHTWAYGQILPRAYWSSQYILADYWLFALEVPPAGYEWVRDGSDALLISVDTGEILQVEYGVFA
jgi:Ni/Co efflux regulator RcnB